LIGLVLALWKDADSELLEMSGYEHLAPVSLFGGNAHPIELMFADIRSPQSVQNIEHNPSTVLDVVDPLVHKGIASRGGESSIVRMACARCTGTRESRSHH
jgi:hypothetical protein